MTGYLRIICVAAGVLAPLPSFGQADNLWIMWERLPPAAGQQAAYRSHLMFGVPRGEVEAFFDNLAPSARRYGSADLRHATAPFCMAEDPPPPPLLPASLPDAGRTPVERIETLRGLDGVFADLRGVRGPAGYRSNFGQDVQDTVARALEQAGIPLLSREAAETAPGRPTLALRFSPEVAGCRPWSVSLSLTQNVVLTRDTATMIAAVTWSGSARQSEQDVDYAPLDAVQDAVASFVKDYRKVNGPAPPPG